MPSALVKALLTTFVLPSEAFVTALRPLPLLVRSLPVPRIRSANSVDAGFSVTRNTAGIGRAWLSNRHPSSSFRLMAMVAAGAGQNLGEMFDLYEAPQPSIAEFRGEPKPKGFNKARKKVHADGDWHRAVHIWLYNSRGELILQKRSDGKDTFPGRWDVSVGGHITSGDDVMHTAHKEVEEELGIKIDVSQLEKLATLATTARGSSPVGGDFICNEYKDLFLLKYEGSVSDLKFSPDEVAAVDSKHWTQVKEDLLAQVNDHQYSTLVWCVHVYYTIQIYIHNTHTHTQTHTQLGPNGEEKDGPMIQRPRHYIEILSSALAVRFPPDDR